MTQLYFSPSDYEDQLRHQRDRYEDLCRSLADTIKALRYQVLILQRFNEEIEKHIDPEIILEVSEYLQSKYEDGEQE